MSQPYSYTQAGTISSSILLNKYDNDNDYLALYTELDTHIQVGDIVYISCSSGISYLDNFTAYQNQDNYPYSDYIQGYQVLFVDLSQNRFTINKFYLELPNNTSLENHYVCLFKGENGIATNYNFDSTVWKNVTLNNCNITQSIILNAAITATTFLSKYSSRYVSLVATNSGYIITLNNNSDGYTYISGSTGINIYLCDIQDGNFYSCNFYGNSTFNTITDGYFESCNIYNYNINGGYFKNCTLGSNCIWNNGTWDNINGYFSPGLWNNGNWNNGTFGTGFTWYNGTFNNGIFTGSTWVDGNFINGIFDSSNWYSGSFNNGTFSSSTWSGGTFNNGNFNGSIWVYGNFYNGTINNSYIYNINFYNGTINNSQFDSLGNCNFYNGTFSGTTWVNGNFYDGIFISSTWVNGNFYDGIFISSTWKDGTFYNGIFENSTWYPILSSSTWNNGIMNNSQWYSGTWLNGIMNNSQVIDNINWVYGTMNSCILNPTATVNWTGGTFNNGNFVSQNITNIPIVISGVSSFISGVSILQYNTSISAATYTSYDFYYYNNFINSNLGTITSSTNMYPANTNNGLLYYQTYILSGSSNLYLINFYSNSACTIFQASGVSSSNVINFSGNCYGTIRLNNYYTYYYNYISLSSASFSLSSITSIVPSTSTNNGILYYQSNILVSAKTYYTFGINFYSDPACTILQASGVSYIKNPIYNSGGWISSCTNFYGSNFSGYTQISWLSSNTYVTYSIPNYSYYNFIPTQIYSIGWISGLTMTVNARYMTSNNLYYHVNMQFSNGVNLPGDLYSISIYANSACTFLLASGSSITTGSVNFYGNTLYAYQPVSFNSNLISGSVIIFVDYNWADYNYQPYVNYSGVCSSWNTISNYSGICNPYGGGSVGVCTSTNYSYNIDSLLVLSAISLVNSVKSNDLCELFYIPPIFSITGVQSLYQGNNTYQLLVPRNNLFNNLSFLDIINMNLLLYSGMSYLYQKNFTATNFSSDSNYNYFSYQDSFHGNILTANASVLWKNRYNNGSMNYFIKNSWVIPSGNVYSGCTVIQLNEGINLSNLPNLYLDKLIKISKFNWYGGNFNKNIFEGYWYGGTWQSGTWYGVNKLSGNWNIPLYTYNNL